jgi:ADP-ribose pyrophosphatase YjhB (NUDIX family)
MLLVALAVVMHAERILLVQEAKASVRGSWNLPGGRVEPGEGVVAAVLREVQEEAGIAVQLKGLLFTDQVLPEADTSESRVRFVFVAEPQSLQAKLKAHEDEHSLGARWFSRTELPRLTLRNRYVIEMVDLAARSPQLLPMSSLRARGDEH